MRILLFVILLLSCMLNSSPAQKKFWDVAGNFPILEKGVNKQMVLKGFDWVEVKDSFFVTITDIAINSDNIILGRIDKDLSRGLYKSNDGGKEWEKVTPTIPISSDPNLKQGLFATEKEYQNLLDRSRYIISDLFAFGKDFYMINGDGQFAGTFLLRSKDLGKTWEKMSTLTVYSKIFPQKDVLLKTENYADVKNSTFLGSNALYVSISQDSGRAWNPLFSGRDTVGYIFVGTDLSIERKYGEKYLKYISENTWYKKSTFDKRKEKLVEHIYESNISIVYQGSESGTSFTLIYPRKTILSLAPDLPDGEAHLAKSTDGGNTWNIVSKVVPGKYRGIHFVDCNDVIYASLESPVEGFCRSTDGGKSWEKLSGLPVNPILYSIEIAPDGIMHYVDKKVLYKSNEKVCATTKQEEQKLNYGTTVITHGWQPPLGANPTSEGEWVYNMANAILQRVGGNGCICRYEKETGLFNKISKVPCKKGEVILIFDWASESNSFSEGYSEAAGDALFAALLLGFKKGDFQLKDIHFIGHSRGTVVNTEAVERLLVLKNNYTQYNGVISIGQVTNLDAHDWGGPDAWFSTDYDNHPNLVFNFPEDKLPNNGTIAWNGVGFYDSYFQTMPVLHNNNPNFLDGRAVECTYNVNWTGYAKDHSDIHEKYRESITENKLNKNNKGYCYSRIGGMINRPPIIGCNNINYSKHSTEFDFYKEMEFTKENKMKLFQRIRGITNGSFDRTSIRIFPDMQTPAEPFLQSSSTFGLEIPGWEQHGGGLKGDLFYKKIIIDNHGNDTEIKIPVEVEDGILKMNSYQNSTKPVSITHNRLYVPFDASKISFKIKTSNIKTASLKVFVVKQNGSEEKVLQKTNLPEPILANYKEFKEFFFDVKPYQDAIITIEFEFVGKPITGDICSVSIDDVKFVKALSDFDKAEKDIIVVSQQNVETSSTEKSTLIVDENTPTRIFNGGFDNSNGWSFSGGNVLFKEGRVSLQTDKKKAPLELKHRTFQIPNNVTYLNLKYDKSKVGEAEFKVLITSSGKSEEIYKERISQTIEKINKGVVTFDKLLKGELPPDENRDNKLETISVDISKYQGMAVGLEISYETLGLGKPRLIVEDISFE